MIELLSALTEEDARGGRYASALAWFYRWAVCAPFDESVHGKMIGLQMLVNGTATAEATARRAAERFREELGIEPDIDMEQLKNNPLQFFNILKE